MGVFEGCLLASDIDGTLLASGYLPQRNIDAIERFTSEGGAFSLSTGRSIGAVGMVTDKIKFKTPCITGNGSVMYDYSAKKIVYSNALTDKDKYVVKCVKNRFPELGIELHCGEQVIVLTEDSETVDHETYEGIESRIATFEDAAQFEWNKVLFMIGSGNHAAEIKEYMNTFEKDGYFIDTNAEVYGRMRYYYEMMPQGSSKASALIQLKKMLGIKDGFCFAIGDYYNDVEMLKAADVSAVTAGSPDELKAIANVTVGDVRDGAVADFIEYIEKTIKNKNC